MIRIIKSRGYSGIRIFMVISLGKNPIRGGIPLIDMIIKGVVINISLWELHEI